MNQRIYNNKSIVDAIKFDMKHNSNDNDSIKIDINIEDSLIGVFGNSIPKNTNYISINRSHISYMFYTKLESNTTYSGKNVFYRVNIELNSSRNTNIYVDFRDELSAIDFIDSFGLKTITKPLSDDLEILTRDRLPHLQFDLVNYDLSAIMGLKTNLPLIDVLKNSYENYYNPNKEEGGIIKERIQELIKLLTV